MQEEPIQRTIRNINLLWSVHKKLRKSKIMNSKLLQDQNIVFA